MDKFVDTTYVHDTGLITILHCQTIKAHLMNVKFFLLTFFEDTFILHLSSILFSPYPARTKK